jgi:hypothetical protein
MAVNMWCVRVFIGTDDPRDIAERCHECSTPQAGCNPRFPDAVRPTVVMGRFWSAKLLSLK